MRNTDYHSHQKSHLKRTLLSSSEGRLLVIGIVSGLLYFIWLGMKLLVHPTDFQGLLGMTATEIVFGRVACLAFGYSLKMNHATVISLCMIIETILVFIFYPLFTLIWRQLLVIKWLKRISDRTRNSAEKHKDIVQRYGIIGLFLFVWVPFWMTGPVVGCMIGHLLGLRVWVNITTVLAGTYVAILGWAFFLRHLHERFASYSEFTSLFLIVLIIVLACIQLLRRIFHKNKKAL